MLSNDARICVNVLHGLDDIQEEIRLALTNPAYETQTKKRIQAQQFFEALNYFIKKDIAAYIQFIITVETKFNDIMEDIQSIEAREREKPRSNHGDNIKKIKTHDSDEIERERAEKLSRLSGLIQQKISLLNQFISSIEKNIHNLESRKTNVGLLISIEFKEIEKIITSHLTSGAQNQEYRFKITTSGVDNYIEFTSQDINKMHMEHLLNLANNKNANLSIDTHEFSKKFIHEQIKKHHNDPNVDPNTISTYNEISSHIQLHVENNQKNITNATSKNKSNLSKLSTKLDNIKSEISILESLKSQAINMKDELLHMQDNINNMIDNPNLSISNDPEMPKMLIELQQLESAMNTIQIPTSLESQMDDLFSELNSTFQDESMELDLPDPVLPTTTNSTASMFQALNINADNFKHANDPDFPSEEEQKPPSKPHINNHSIQHPEPSEEVTIKPNNKH